MFWTKQAFWTSVLLFGLVLLAPHMSHPLHWLFLLEFILATWVCYNQPVDKTGTVGNRHHDLRPAFVALGIAFFSIGYFGLTGPGVSTVGPIAYGFGTAFLPMIAVEACRPAEATKKGFSGEKVFAFFVWSLCAAVMAGVGYFLGYGEFSLEVLVIGQCVQLFLALVFDHAEYAKTHRSPFILG